MAIGDQLAYDRLRRDIGTTQTNLDDTEAEAIFVEAAERYPDDSAKRTAYTRVIAIRGIRADAAKLGRYAANQSEEDLRKVFDNLTVMLKDWQDEVATVSDPPAAGYTGGAFFAVARGRRGR